MAQQLSGIQTNIDSFDPRYEQVRVAFQAAEEGFATLVVFGPDGGWLLSLGEARIHQGANTLTWMGRDSEGVPVSNGTYTLELFGFDRARHPAAATALRAEVGIKNSPGNEHERGAAQVSLHWLPWIELAAHTTRLYSSS